MSGETSQVKSSQTRCCQWTGDGIYIRIGVQVIIEGLTSNLTRSQRDWGGSAEELYDKVPNNV